MYSFRVDKSSICSSLKQLNTKNSVLDKYVPFKPVSEVETEIDDHRKNIVNTVGQNDTGENKGYWQVPKLEEGTTAVMDETRADRDDYGSYHIAVNKWFATESLDKIWQYSVQPDAI